MNGGPIMLAIKQRLKTAVHRYAESIPVPSRQLVDTVESRPGTINAAIVPVIPCDNIAFQLSWICLMVLSEVRSTSAESTHPWWRIHRPDIPPRKPTDPIIAIMINTSGSPQTSREGHIGLVLVLGSGGIGGVDSERTFSCIGSSDHLSSTGTPSPSHPSFTRSDLRVASNCKLRLPKSISSGLSWPVSCTGSTFTSNCNPSPSPRTSRVPS